MRMEVRQAQEAAGNRTDMTLSLVNTNAGANSLVNVERDWIQSN